MQPIFFGDPSNHTELGVLVLGSEINSQTAEDVRQVASSQVAFWRGSALIVSTLPPHQMELLKRHAPFQFSGAGITPADIDLGGGMVPRHGKRYSTRPITQGESNGSQIVQSGHTVPP